VENAHDDAFSQGGGDRRDAEIDIGAADRDLDAAVLRHAPFSNVELGHDLDARGHGGSHVERQHLRRLQQAVDTVTNEDEVDGGLDVNVGRPGLHRVGDDLVDEANDRRFAGEIAQTLNVELAGGSVGCEAWTV